MNISVFVRNYMGIISYLWLIITSIIFRPGIPSSFLGDFHKKVPNAIFTSNPCRIQYCAQEIVVFREDMISKMCRNSIYTPWEHEEKVDIPNLVSYACICKLKKIAENNVCIILIFYNSRKCCTLFLFKIKLHNVLEC